MATHVEDTQKQESLIHSIASSKLDEGYNQYLFKLI